MRLTAAREPILPIFCSAANVGYRDTINMTRKFLAHSEQ